MKNRIVVSPFIDGQDAVTGIQLAHLIFYGTEVPPSALFPVICSCFVGGHRQLTGTIQTY